MKCLDCQERLQQHLDGLHPAGDGHALAPELEQHLAQCSSCKSFWLAGQILLKGIAALPRPTPPPDFAQRLTGMVLEDRRSRQRRARVRWLVTGAMAASLLIMALAGYFFLPVPHPPENHPVARDKDQKPREIEPEITVKKDEAPNVRQSVQDARQAFAALTEKLSDKAREQTKLFLSLHPLELPPMEPGLDMGETLVELEPAAQSLRQAGQGVAEGLQPVTQTARRALNYFFRELAVLESTN